MVLRITQSPTVRQQVIVFFDPVYRIRISHVESKTRTSDGHGKAEQGTARRGRAWPSEAGWGRARRSRASRGSISIFGPIFELEDQSEDRPSKELVCGGSREEAAGFIVLSADTVEDGGCFLSSRPKIENEGVIRDSKPKIKESLLFFEEPPSFEEALPIFGPIFGAQDRRCKGSSFFGAENRRLKTENNDFPPDMPCMRKVYTPKGVGPLVSSQERRAAAVSLINHL